MAEYGNMDVAFAGMKAEDIQFDSIRTRSAKDIIDFGKPVFGYQGDDVSGYNFYLDTSKIVFSADFVTDNVVTVTVNGEVAVIPFNTDHETTGDDVVTAIKALDILDNNGNTINPDCIKDSADTDERTFYLRGLGVDVTVTAVVTLGASQATATITYQSDQVSCGLAKHNFKECVTKIAGVNYARYEIDDAISVVEKGIYYALINDVTLLSDQVCYIDNAGADKGNYTNVAGNDMGGIFRSNTLQNTYLDQKIAKLELRGIKKLNAVINWT